MIAQRAPTDSPTSKRVAVRARIGRSSAACAYTIALLSIGCNYPHASRLRAAPAGGPQPGVAYPSQWTPAAEHAAAEHFIALSDTDAAVALRVYERAHVDEGFEQRARVLRSLSREALQMAASSSFEEAAYALAYPIGEARRRVLRALVLDSDPTVRAVVSEALLLNGVSDRLPTASSRDAGTFSTALRAWEAIRSTAAPAKAEAFFAFTRSNSEPLLWGQAALALAEAGDLRAVPLLAALLRTDPQRVQFGMDPKELWAVRVTDKVTSRMAFDATHLLEDLALNNPSHLATIRVQSEAALTDWVDRADTPYPEGPIAAAALGSRKLMTELRDMAFPDVSLPTPDAEWSAPRRYLISRSAMHALAKLRDLKSFPLLVDQLKRRPVDFDASLPAPGKPGWALATALMDIGCGAAEALGSWGDSRAYQPLRIHARDPFNSAPTRVCACRAIVQLVPEPDLPLLLESVIPKPEDGETQRQFSYCMLQAFELRPVRVEALWSILENSAPGFRNAAARILGFAGLTTDGLANRARLAELRKESQGSDDRAMLAWLGVVGGDARTAVEILRRNPGMRGDDSDLASFWATSLPSIGHDDVDSGRLFRIVRNGVAMSRELKPHAGPSWPTWLLSGMFDSGGDARALRRPILRKRLFDLSRGDSDDQADGAVWTLALMREGGFLLSLLDVAGIEPNRAARRQTAVRNALRFIETNMQSDGTEPSSTK